jgi:hypothetical protein
MDKRNDEFSIKAKKATLIFTSLCFMLLTGLVFCGLSEAAGGWQWRFNLVSPEAKEPFQMPTSLYIVPEAERFYVVES